MSPRLKRKPIWNLSSFLLIWVLIQSGIHVFLLIRVLIQSGIYVLILIRVLIQSGIYVLILIKAKKPIWNLSISPNPNPNPIWNLCISPNLILALIKLGISVFVYIRSVCPRKEHYSIASCRMKFEAG